MAVEIVLLHVVNITVTSILLFLVASGLSITFGLMNMLNLAHGTFFLLGGYIGWTISAITGSFWLALFVSPVVVAGLGYLLETLFVRKIYTLGYLPQVLLTYGFSLIGIDVIRFAWGSNIKSIPPPQGFTGSIEIFSLTVPSYRMALLVLGACFILLIFLVFERTTVGALVRAAVDDPEMLSVMGVNTPSVVRIVFSISLGVAALSGVISGPVFNLYPGLDNEMLLLALAVVITGGLGSFRGVLLSSFIIGTVDVIGKWLVPEFYTSIIFLFMSAMLLARPSGLGRQDKRSAS